MASRGAAGVRLAAMAAAAGFGLIGLAQGMAALSTATRHSAQPVLSLVPIVWSRYLGGSTAVPAFLSEFLFQKKPSGGRATLSSGSGSATVSLDSVLEVVKRTAGGAVDADAPLMESGVDSLGAVELRNQLQSAAGSGISLPSTLVFDFPTARQLASALQPKQANTAPATSLKEMAAAQASGAVSIDGTSALFPGGAPSILTASRLVASGSVAVAEVPAMRWDIHAQPALPEPTASRVRHLGFVRDAELADNVALLSHLRRLQRWIHASGWCSSAATLRCTTLRWIEQLSAAASPASSWVTPVILSSTFLPLLLQGVASTLRQAGLSLLQLVVCLTHLGSTGRAFHTTQRALRLLWQLIRLALASSR